MELFSPTSVGGGSVDVRTGFFSFSINLHDKDNVEGGAGYDGHVGIEHSISLSTAIVHRSQPSQDGVHGVLLSSYRRWAKA